jgi:antitoxin component YwqK of YwqJK toxin-antitoxin module
MKQINIIIISFLLLATNCKNAELKESYFANGKLSERYTLVEGKFHGKYTSFYENGNLRAEGQYENNIMVGEWKYYYEDGEMLSRQKFEKGKLIFLEAWDEESNLIVKDGTGTFILNYPDGSKMSSTSYKNCKKNGAWISWYENGVKANESHFIEGEPTGIWSYWDEKGNLIERKEYNKDGKLVESHNN